MSTNYRKAVWRQSTETAVAKMIGIFVIAQTMLSQIVQELPEEASNRLRKTFDEVVHHTHELKSGVTARCPFGCGLTKIASI